MERNKLMETEDEGVEKEGVEKLVKEILEEERMQEEWRILRGKAAKEEKMPRTEKQTLKGRRKAFTNYLEKYRTGAHRSPPRLKSTLICPGWKEECAAAKVDWKDIFVDDLARAEVEKEAADRGELQGLVMSEYAKRHSKRVAYRNKRWGAPQAKRYSLVDRADPKLIAIEELIALHGRPTVNPLEGERTIVAEIAHLEASPRREEAPLDEDIIGRLARNLSTRKD
jgi:hypothetical protein